jgi:hypothetical protein
MANDGRKRINDMTLSRLGEAFLKFGPKPVPLDFTLPAGMFDEG